MSSSLRKAVCFSPSGTIFPSPSNTQSLHYQNAPGSYANLIFLRDSGTRWIRIFVDLYKMWPSESVVDINMRDQLDMQIALAKGQGLGVVLAVNYQLPRWITGAATPNKDDPDAVTTTGKWLEGLAVRVH